MDRHSHIFITAVERYINDLTYIAKESTSSLNNMMNFFILTYIYEWTYELGEKRELFKQLFNKIEWLIAKDEYLSHYILDQVKTLDQYEEGQYPTHFTFKDGTTVAWAGTNIGGGFRVNLSNYYTIPETDDLLDQKLNTSDLYPTLSQALLDAKNSGDFKGDKGDKGEQGIQGEKGDTTKAVFTYDDNSQRIIVTDVDFSNTNLDLLKY